MTETAGAQAHAASMLRGVVDCDVHNTVPRIEALFPYLDDHWREYCTQSAFRGPADTSYPKNVPTSARPDALPPGGGPAGSDLATLRAQALDAAGVEVAILTCAYEADSIHNPDTAAAMARAVNDWQIAEWLDKEPRLRASIVVPSQQPEMAAREIDRVGDHPGFVQVFLPARSRFPYGNRRNEAIFEAAVRHDLVVGIHFGGTPGNPPTPSGWPTHYIEDYAGMAQVFQSQVVSMVAEGLFNRLPTLRVAVIEGGWTWLAALMWRFDREWRDRRQTVPWLRRPPSEYIREHFRLTIQPLDAPPNPAHLTQLLEQLGSDEMLMYASDYPHLHLDDPVASFVSHLPSDLARGIMADNARALYRL